MTATCAKSFANYFTTSVSTNTGNDEGDRNDNKRLFRCKQIVKSFLSVGKFLRKVLKVMCYSCVCVCMVCKAVENRDRVQTPHTGVSEVVSHILWIIQSSSWVYRHVNSLHMQWKRQSRGNNREREVKVQSYECNEVSMTVMACMGGFLHPSLILHRLKICK